MEKGYGCERRTKITQTRGHTLRNIRKLYVPTIIPFSVSLALIIGFEDSHFARRDGALPVYRGR